jgi:hypothetical protein
VPHAAAFKYGAYAGEAKSMKDRRTRRYPIGAIVAIAGAVAIVPARAQDQNTPRGMMQVRLSGLEKADRERTGPSPKLSSRMDLVMPGSYMVTGDPGQAVDLSEWSEVSSGVGEMPLNWEPGDGRFRIIERQLVSRTSDAQVWFTWNFLRAYAKLSDDLRKSGSILAVGVAALVAADRLYPENWACLPAETRDAAAIATLLRLYAPGSKTALHDACVGENSRDRKKLLREAVGAMNRSDNADAPAVEPLVKLDWLDSTPLTRRASVEPMKLATFLPKDPDALERLIERVHKDVPNLTIRARIIAAALPRRYGLPGSTTPEKDEAARNWEQHLRRLLEAQRQELSIRDEGSDEQQSRAQAIVPPFQAGDLPLIRVRSDPAVLEPLMYIAGHVARHRLRAAKQKAGVDGFRAALKSENPTSDVIALAGVEPVVEVHPGNGTDIEPAMTRLTWSKLERITSRADEQRYTESVYVDLIDDRPTGQGRALGIGADNRLVVIEPGGRRTLRLAGKLERGASVLGYVGTDQPTREGMFRTQARVREAAFRVLDRLNTSKTAAVELRLGDGSRLLFGDEHRVLVSLGQYASWRKAGNLQSDRELWNRPPEKGNLADRRATIKEVAISPPPAQLVELSLSWNEERGKATNVVVLPPGDDGAAAAEALARGPVVLAEASSRDFGPIAPESLVETIGRAPQEVTTVRADNLSTSPIQPSVLTGYLHQGEDDVWREAPWLSQHTCRALAREPIAVVEAFRLKFKSGKSLVLGLGNWVLIRKEDPKGVVATQRPVVDLHVGDELVSGLHDRDLLSERLEAIEPEALPPGKPTSYILIRAENLSWAKVGPVLVSIEAKVREDDAAAEGLASATTTLALTGASGELQYRSVTSIGEPNDAAKDWRLAAVDPAVPKLLAEAVIAGVHSRATTHTVRIELGAEKALGTPPRALDCAPGQLLLVLRQFDEGQGQNAGKRLAISAARDLRPGDELIEFARGQTSASSQRVVRMLDRFLEPPVTMLMLENRKPRYFEMNRATLVNDGIAVVLSADGELGIRTGHAPEGLPGEGRNSGDAPGPQVQKGQLVPDPDSALTATLRSGETEDIIQFPNDANETVLKRFGTDLLAQIEADAPNLHAPAVAATPLLRYWESKFADLPVHWRRRAGNVAPELREWVGDLVRSRDQFLKEPRAQALPSILLREMIVASWLRAAGAPKPADMILTDLLELAIFTGCEKGKERVRLGRDLRLALVLYAPAFVRGEKDAREIEPVSLAAQALLRNWGGDELVADGGVVLPSLYRMWRKTSEKRGLTYGLLPLFWEPFTAIDVNGGPKDQAAAARREFGDMVAQHVRAFGREQRLAGSSR